MSEFLTKLENWKDTVEFQAGDEIISEGAAGTDLYVILSGEVELSLRGTSLGKESAGGIIGEMAMLASTAGNPTAKAVGQVRLARLSCDQFTRLLSENPDFSHQALLAMANRLRAANAFIRTQLEARE
ncbi:MAG TPA: cyclic nucleotide-binding domain-containing protein [Xanthomonadales bacterium]|nr:cyclic nucleotide-binding domain-containing protein [Xanthomonadales bacterium]